jgi:hypothetical protein
MSHSCFTASGCGGVCEAFRRPLDIHEGRYSFIQLVMYDVYSRDLIYAPVLNDNI